MANANGIETRVSTSQSCINRSTPFGCKTRLKRLICISFNWSTRDREREINNGRKDGWRATSHVRALKSPALSRFLFLFLHVGIRTIPFKGIPSDDISRSARFNDCFLSTRKRIFAWRERRRDSILTLRFSWEEIIYRDRESENSNVSSNFLSNFLEKIQIYNNNSKHFRYSFRFHSFHRVSICYSANLLSLFSSRNRATILDVSRAGEQRGIVSSVQRYRYSGAASSSGVGRVLSGGCVLSRGQIGPQLTEAKQEAGKT